MVANRHAIVRVRLRGQAVRTLRWLTIITRSARPGRDVAEDGSAPVDVNSDALVDCGNTVDLRDLDDGEDACARCDRDVVAT